MATVLHCAVFHCDITIDVTDLLWTLVVLLAVVLVVIPFLVCGGPQPIFTMSAQQNQLKDLTEEEFNSFTSSYSYTPVSSVQYYTYLQYYYFSILMLYYSKCVVFNSQSALQFLEAYSHEDITVAELQGSSNSLWTISPPSRQYLSQVLHLDHFPLTVSWTIQRSALSC